MNILVSHQAVPPHILQQNCAHAFDRQPSESYDGIHQYVVAVKLLPLLKRRS